ncbi:MAG TPA: transketolase C-terminal domain-containing protein [Methanomassiliicoccales archaeon]|nr:transketolase C-terminal domain-containing protein [Methanomassiliicoccales archaeon]
MEAQRKSYGRALVDLGRARGDVVVLDADLSSSTRTVEFKGAFPGRFFNCGIAEQNMMGTAAGLAVGGMTVFASTFAVFATGRAYDQVRQSIAYPDLNVKIVASHAGITVGGDGASHQTMEDIALMNALPNMTVVVPADGPETYKAVLAVAERHGPAYVRMGRGDVPVVTSKEERFEIGRAHILREGADVALVGTGQMVAACLLAAEALKARGVSAKVIDLHTIKPLDVEALEKAARECGAVVTAEEHNIVSGVGTLVAAALAERYPVPMERVAMQDVFGQSGESEELMREYGLTDREVLTAAIKAMERKK